MTERELLDAFKEYLNVEQINLWEDELLEMISKYGREQYQRGYWERKPWETDDER